MGFWDTASKVGKFALDAGTTIAQAAGEKAEKIRATTNEYSNKGDNELIEIVRSEGFFGNSTEEKAIARAILRKRGVDV